MEIAEIKNKVSMRLILDTYQVRVGNGPSSWYCPFHDDKSPSFICTPEGHTWKCSGPCDISGDEIEFIQKADGVSKGEAVKRLKDIFGIIDDFAPNLKLDELKKEHRDFLKKRGIDPDRAIKKFGIKARITTHKGKHSSQICFPEPDKNGNINSFKYIDINDKVVQGAGGDAGERGAKTFPAPVYKGVTSLFILAGHWDLLIFDQEFEKEYPDRVSTTAIRTFSSGEKNVAKDIYEITNYPDLKNVYIIYDNDDSGIRGAEKLAKEIQKLGKNAIVKTWPKEFKKGFDTNDWLFMDKDNHGTIKQIIDLPETKYKAFSQEEIKKLSTGVKKTDEEIVIETILTDSQKIQKAVLFYLLSSNESIGLALMTLNSMDFLNLKYRGWFNLITEKYMDIGVCDIEKFAETEPSVEKELFTLEIQIRNDEELVKYIDKLKSYSYKSTVFHHANTMKNLALNILSMTDDELSSELNQASEKLHAGRRRSNKKKSVTMYDTMMQHIENPQPFVEVAPVVIFPVFNAYAGGGVPYGKMTLIGARPSVGKTTFMTNLIDELARANVLGIYSMEMQANELGRISFALSSNHSLNKITDGVDEHFLNNLRKSVKDYHKNIHIFTGYRDPAEIAQDIRMRHRRYGMRIFFLDHFHLLKIDASGKMFKDVRHFYNYWSTYFSDLADELGIAIVILCQLNRNTEGRTKAKPKLGDLKESGNLEQDAYNVIFIYAEDAEKQQSSPIVKIIFGKARGGTAGIDIDFKYQRHLARFEEVSF